MESLFRPPGLDAGHIQAVVRGAAMDGAVRNAAVDRASDHVEAQTPRHPLQPRGCGGGLGEQG